MGTKKSFWKLFWSQSFSRNLENDPHCVWQKIFSLAQYPWNFSHMIIQKKYFNLGGKNKFAIITVKVSNWHRWLISNLGWWRNFYLLTSPLNKVTFHPSIFREKSSIFKHHWSRFFMARKKWRPLCIDNNNHTGSQHSNSKA